MIYTLITYLENPPEGSHITHPREKTNAGNESLYFGVMTWLMLEYNNEKWRKKE